MKDKWFFIIKSGKAKVLKKVRLSFEEYMDNFKLTRQTTDPDIMRAYKKEEKKLRNEYKYLFDKYTFNEKINHEKYAYLLVDTLKQGEMFGFPDMVLKDDIDYNSAYMLVSDETECILSGFFYKFFFILFFITHQAHGQIKIRFAYFDV
jgi:hypothetical protein